MTAPLIQCASLTDAAGESQSSQRRGVGVQLHSAFQCRVINARQCDDQLMRQWAFIRKENPALWSPFFSPEFTTEVARVRDDCELAIVESAGQPIALLPFHRQGNSLFPIARSINDAHGIISAPSVDIDWSWLLKQIGATSYQYHALFALPHNVHESSFGTNRTFLCDLNLPEEGYIAWLESNRKTIKKQRRKTKKLIQDVGPLRLDFACMDPAALERTIQLKSQQYQNTKIFDIFSVDWIRQMMHNMIHRSGDIEGRLSVLYAGDNLVAAHLGMQEGKLLHYWFPVYDPAYSFASPGTALFLEIVRQASQNHVDKIDFGYGELPYKWILNNVIDESPFGVFSTSAAGWYGKRVQHQASKAVRRLPGKEVSKRVLRKVLPRFGVNKYS